MLEAGQASISHWALRETAAGSECVCSVGRRGSVKKANTKTNKTNSISVC